MPVLTVGNQVHVHVCKPGSAGSFNNGIQGLSPCAGPSVSGATDGSEVIPFKVYQPSGSALC